MGVPLSPSAAVLLAVSTAGLVWSPDARADLDVAFLLDTTGSMSGEIAEARTTVRGLAETLAASRPNERIRIGIVAYKDRSDAWLTKVSDLSTDVDTSFDFLSRLTAEGGGDSPEDVLSGIEAVLEELSWEEGAERQVFLIGDAPAHTERAVDLDMDALLAEARDRRIVINAIGCRSLGRKGVEQYRRIAYETEGQYHHIGRVSTGDPGLAEAMIASLTESSDEAVAWEAVGIYPSHDRAPSPATDIARRGLVVRLGEWSSAHHREDWGAQSCMLTVAQPDGMRLVSTPKVESSTAGLRVELALQPGSGGVDTFELATCFSRSTPLRIQITEDPS